MALDTGWLMRPVEGTGSTRWEGWRPEWRKRNVSGGPEGPGVGFMVKGVRIGPSG